jgi:hypothetical protein
MDRSALRTLRAIPNKSINCFVWTSLDAMPCTWSERLQTATDETLDRKMTSRAPPLACYDWATTFSLHPRRGQRSSRDCGASRYRLRDLRQNPRLSRSPGPDDRGDRPSAGPPSADGGDDASEWRNEFETYKTISFDVARNSDLPSDIRLALRFGNIVGFRGPPVASIQSLKK